MNMAQDCEISYRKVYPVQRTYQNSVFFGNPGKLSITDEDINRATLRNEEYHKQIGPVLNMLRLLGILPLQMPSHGVPEFRFFSPVMAYSACVHLIKTFTIYNVLRTAVLPNITRRHDFVSTVLSWMSILSAFVCTVSPILMWLDSHKWSLHIKKWLQFQSLYRKVTGQHLILAVRKRYVRSYVGNILAGIAVTTFTITAPINKLWMMPFTFFLATTLGAFGIYCVASYFTLTVAGQKLALSLKKGLKQRKVSAYLIGEYRVLWLQLSQLASQTGDVMGKATIFLLTTYLFALTMSLYGCVAGILNKGHLLMETAGSGIGFVLGVISLYGICTQAHEVTETIETEILEELQLMKSCCLQPEIKFQVRKFLQTISMNPPVISVLGFVTINKGLVKSYASSLVTYIIVLSQFSMGQPKNNSVCNVTHNTTGTD